MLMLFLTVALVHLIALMSRGRTSFRVANRRQPLAPRGDDGRGRHFARHRGMGRRGVDGAASDPAEDGWLHQIIMVGGGIYLCWMGWQLLRSARAQQRSRRRRPVALPKAGRSFIRGFLTNLSNPKAVIYFGSVFSLFVGDSVGAGARWGLFLLIVAETFVWFSRWRWCSRCRRCAAATSGWPSGSTG